MQHKVSFGELKIGDMARELINSALDKNWVSEGENVRAFERGFADKFGYKYAITTSSGTDADIVACASLYDLVDAKRGDEIITTASTFVAVANSILAAGFIPKFVDIDQRTLNIDPEKIEDAITAKTKAMLIVHNMGKPAPMMEIMQIARNHNLVVLEDCCESHNAHYKGEIVGAIGDMGTFSFYAAHMIVCGEGGMVVTDREDVANIIRSVKSHGRPLDSNYFDFQRIGFNSKANELTAAIGIEGLAKFDKVFVKRRQNLFRLLELTADLREYCQFIEEEAGEIICPHAFPIVLKEQPCADLYEYLESKGIQCKTLFGSLPTQHDAFKFLGYQVGQFPMAEYVGTHGLHFGIHQYLSGSDIEYISDTLHKWFNRRIK